MNAFPCGCYAGPAPVSKGTTLRRACASVIALARLPSTSLLCSVATMHNGWRHYCSRSLCASQTQPPQREPVPSHCSSRLHGHHAHSCAPMIALVHLRSTSLLLQCGRHAPGLAPLLLTVALHLTDSTPTARASASPLIKPSPWAPRSLVCPCDCAGTLAKHSSASAVWPPRTRAGATTAHGRSVPHRLDPHGES